MVQLFNDGSKKAGGEVNKEASASGEEIFGKKESASIVMTMNRLLGFSD